MGIKLLIALVCAGVLAVLTGGPARGADGECRLLYAGNLAVCTADDRAWVSSTVAELRAAGTTEETLALLLSPGPVMPPDPTDTRGDIAALGFAAALSPDAVLLGLGEVKRGVDYLTFRLPARPLPWISANRAQPGLRTAIARLLTAGPLRIGVIGLSLEPGAFPEKAVRDSLARQLALLQPRCDVLVLLGAFDALQAPVLATLYPRLDVLLGCSGETVPQAAGNAVLAPADPARPYVGQLELAVREGRLVAWRGRMLIRDAAPAR